MTYAEFLWQAFQAVTYLVLFAAMLVGMFFLIGWPWWVNDKWGWKWATAAWIANVILIFHIVYLVIYIGDMTNR